MCRPPPLNVTSNIEVYCTRNEKEALPLRGCVEQGGNVEVGGWRPPRVKGPFRVDQQATMDATEPGVPATVSVDSS